MSTNDLRVNIYLKKFLPQQQMQENFQFYLQDKLENFLSIMYPEQGVFTDITNLLSSTANDTFDVKTPLIATDALGHLLAPDPSRVTQVDFENASGVDYQIGLRFNYLDAADTNTVETNVRTGKFEYTFDQESIGEMGDPDNVVDNGSNLTLRVNSITEAGVDNSGRTVRVFLKPRQDGGSIGPLSESEPYEDVTVVFSGGNNEITTIGLLGQTAGDVSTDTNDYRCYLLGPSVKRNTDLTSDPNIVFLGTITGSGSGSTPTIFDLAGVNPLYTTGDLTDLVDSVMIYYTGGGLVTWDLDASTLTWDDTFNILIPARNYSFQIAANSISINNNQVAYFIKDQIGGAKTLTVADIGSISSDVDIEPILIRTQDNIYFKNGGLELKGQSGDTTSGRIDDITQDLMTFMGAVNESDSDPNYSSANVVTQGNSLTSAIGELDAQVFAILTDTAEEEDFVVGVGGQTNFIASTMSWNISSNITDILVFVNGKKQKQDTSGGLSEDFRKVSTIELEFSYTIPENARVTIHSVRTGGGGTSSIVTVAGEWKVEYHTVTAGEYTAKQFTMAETPTDATTTLVDLLNGSSQQYSVDFNIAGNILNWSGLGMDGIVNIGDVIRLAYFFTP